MTSEVVEPTRAVDVLRRPWVAALVVLVVYGVLALLNSTGGYLGTDTGAKVITLDRMAEERTFSPAVGYWAEEWDPDGNYHPLFDTRQNEDGEWINVTTLPMLIAARPLYELGGYTLALVYPMLGSLLGAFACRDIARRLADERAGWWAFWVAALASPLTIYALDFWEHSLGAGFMLAAIALLLRVLDGGPLLLAALAGAALGASATMRAETFVVTLVAVGAVCLALLARRAPLRSIGTGGLSVIGFAIPWLGNAVLDSALGGNPRTERISAEAQRQWWTELGERGEEALITWFALPNAGYPASVFLGAFVVLAAVAAVARLRRGDERGARIALLLAGLVYLLSFLFGLGFVSGALIASPFAAAAGLARGDRRWFLIGMALVMTVLTWTFQLTGGAGPQWGGRYLLTPTLLLTTLGVVALAESRSDRPLRIAFAAFSVAVTLFGAAWLHHRSHEVEGFFEEVAAQPEDVVISTNGFFVREAGPAYDDRRYLSVGRRGDVEGAVEVARAAGAETVAILTLQQSPPELDNADLVDSDRFELVGVPFWYHRIALSPAE